jgi:hypothetical protein
MTTFFNIDACRMEVTNHGENLGGNTKFLTDLQAKLNSVEKEYLLLYQQQAQEQHKN